MWNFKNSLRTEYRYAYDVRLIDPKRLTGNRWLWQQYSNLKWEAECWCEEHCTKGWSLGYQGLFSFDSKDDAMMFKLTWAGRLS